MVSALIATKGLGCLCWFDTDGASVLEKFAWADVAIYGEVIPDAAIASQSNGDVFLMVILARNFEGSFYNESKLLYLRPQLRYSRLMGVDYE